MNLLFFRGRTETAKKNVRLIHVNNSTVTVGSDAEVKEQNVSGERTVEDSTPKELYTE